MSAYDNLKAIKAGADMLLLLLEDGFTENVIRVLDALHGRHGVEVADAFEVALWSVYADLDFKAATGLSPQFRGNVPLFYAYSHATPEQEYAIACALLSYCEFLEPVEAPTKTSTPKKTPDQLLIPSARLRHWSKVLQSTPSSKTCVLIASQIDEYLST